MDNPALGRPEGGQPDAIVKGSGVVIPARLKRPPTVTLDSIERWTGECPVRPVSGKKTNRARLALERSRRCVRDVIGGATVLCPGENHLWFADDDIGGEAGPAGRHPDKP